MRLWASVALSLLLAFWLQMDNPFWAATSAALVCQPSLGASLRKANFRLVGTVIGAVATVGMMAAFPQDRVGFLVTLAAWCGLCGVAATLLQNFASYGAALAGYTAVIIASSAISNPANTFLLAVWRASEICLGIVCAGVVLVLTGRGTARARAATTIATIARETGLGIRATLHEAGGPPRESWAERRALIGRAMTLSALLDETVGESSDVRVRSQTLQAAVNGLLAALSWWRVLATHLENLPPAQAAADAAPVIAVLPRDAPIVMTAESSPADTRDRCGAAAATIAAVPVSQPGLKLVLLGAELSLRGLEQALNGVALLVEPARAHDIPGEATLRVPDLLPSVINGARCFVVILALAVFWIVTAWPSGPGALVFAAIILLLLPPRGDAAMATAWGFLWGTLFTSVLAAFADFALLPGLEGFTKLAVVMGLFLVPLAALSAGTWQTGFFIAAATNFTPIMAPANVQSFDTVAFYNSTLAIGVGVGVGVLGMTILPQLSPAHRTRRLRMLTLRDLKRLATRRRPRTKDDWDSLIYSRISALPDSAPDVARSELIASLYVGEAVLRLRALENRFEKLAPLRMALQAVAEGRGGAARRALAEADADVAKCGAPDRQVLRARAAMLALSEALARHANFFGTESGLDAV